MLYILGDILDREPNPIKIILDVMERPNVEVMAGNHCVMVCFRAEGRGVYVWMI